MVRLKALCFAQVIRLRVREENLVKPTRFGRAVEPMGLPKWRPEQQTRRKTTAIQRIIQRFDALSNCAFHTPLSNSLLTAQVTVVIQRTRSRLTISRRQRVPELVQTCPCTLRVSPARPQWGAGWHISADATFYPRAHLCRASPFQT